MSGQNPHSAGAAFAGSSLEAEALDTACVVQSQVQFGHSLLQRSFQQSGDVEAISRAVRTASAVSLV